MTAKKKPTKTANAKKTPKGAKTQQKKTEKMMNNSQQQFDQFGKEAAAFGQESVDAMTQAGTAYFKGFEDLMKTCVGMAQEQGSKQVQAVQSLMACKTLNEFSDAQTKLAQQSFDETMNNATKISEMVVQLNNTCLEPINNQVNKAVKKATKAA